MSTPKYITIKEIEIALRTTMGFQTQAAELLGISQQAISKRIKASPHLQTVIKEIREKELDHAEFNLQKLIKAGNFQAICFYLKCQGKNRGYVERIEQQVEIKDLSTTLEQLKEHLRKMNDKELKEFVKSIKRTSN